MRNILLVICCSISLSASAQIWPFSKKHERFPLLASAKDNSRKRIPSSKLSAVKVDRSIIQKSPYYLYIAEQATIKTAQHNMRYRVYSAASYNFSDLGQMYLKQNRLAEAKWFFLQSIQISRQQNDDRHTIANLIDLSSVKAEYGDLIQAKEDLTEAHELAQSRGLTMDLAAVDKKMHSLFDPKFVTGTKINVPFAETAAADPKAANK